MSKKSKPYKLGARSTLIKATQTDIKSNLVKSNNIKLWFDKLFTETKISDPINVLFVSKAELANMPNNCNVISVLDNEWESDIYKRFNSHCIVPISSTAMNMLESDVVKLHMYLGEVVANRINDHTSPLVIHCTEGMIRSYTLASVLAILWHDVFEIRSDYPNVNPYKVIDDKLYKNIRTKLKVYRNDFDKPPIVSSPQ